MVDYYDTSSTWAGWTCDSGTSTCSGTVWGTWTSATYTSSAITYGDYAFVTWVSQEEPKRESREQKRAREAQAKIDEQSRLDQAKAVREAREQAEITAQELLKDLITDEEMTTYLKTGKLLVKGKKHDYLLVKGYQADVIKLEKGKVIDLQNHRAKVKGTSYCVHSVDNHKLPDTDKIIAMKIALEAEEDIIMGQANARGERDIAVNM